MENKQEVESPAPLAWRPEVGKTAWFIDDISAFGIKEGIVDQIEKKAVKLRGVPKTDGPWESNWYATKPMDGVFPTAEAALASIKVYDLNGVEVPHGPRFEEEYTLLREIVRKVLERAQEGDSHYDSKLDGLFEKMDDLVETQDMRIQIAGDPTLNNLMQEAMNLKTPIGTTRKPKERTGDGC